MRNGLLILLCLVLGFATFGCGGGSSTSKNAFAGTYVGTYTNSSTGSGAISLVILAEGQVSGRAINTTSDGTTSISGSITNSGIATLTDSNGTALGNFSLSGGTLTGALTSTTPGSNTTVSITASSATTATAGAYAGSFSGTYLDSNSSNGTMSIIINGNGGVTALIQNVTGVGTTFEATGTITNLGVLKLSQVGGSETITGTLTFNGQTELSGPLTTSGGDTITPTLTSP